MLVPKLLMVMLMLASSSLSAPPSEFKINVQTSNGKMSINVKLVRPADDESETLIVQEIVANGAEPIVPAPNGKIFLKLAKTSEKSKYLVNEWNTYMTIGPANKKVHEGLAMPYFLGEMKPFGFNQEKLDGFCVIGIEYFDMDFQDFLEKNLFSPDLLEQYFLHVGLRIFKIVEFLRSQGIVHRDIKKHNILLNARNPNIVVLGDFGISYHGVTAISYIPRGAASFFMTKHILLRVGTVPSVNDDGENVGYVYIYTISKGLPWTIDNFALKEDDQLLSEYIQTNLTGIYSRIAEPLRDMLVSVRAQKDGSPVVNYGPCITAFEQTIAEVGSNAANLLQNFLVDHERQYDLEKEELAKSCASNSEIKSRSNFATKFLKIFCCK